MHIIYATTVGNQTNAGILPCLLADVKNNFLYLRELYVKKNSAVKMLFCQNPTICNLGFLYLLCITVHRKYVCPFVVQTHTRKISTQAKSEYTFHKAWQITTPIELQYKASQRPQLPPVLLSCQDFEYSVNSVKKSLTTSNRQNLKIDPRVHRRPAGPLQPAPDQGHHRP